MNEKELSQWEIKAIYWIVGLCVLAGTVLFLWNFYGFEMVVYTWKRCRNVDQQSHERNSDRWMLLIESAQRTGFKCYTNIGYTEMVMDPNTILSGMRFDAPTMVVLNDNCILQRCSWTSNAIIRGASAVRFNGTNGLMDSCSFEYSVLGNQP